jgi:hypothetical protein
MKLLPRTAIATLHIAVALIASAGLPTFSRAAESSTTAKASAAAAALDSVQAAELQRHVEFLASDTLEGREAGSRGGQAAGGYLIEQLRKLKIGGGGLQGAYHQNVPTGGRNILALIPGSDEALRREVIVVGAHYDHVGYGNRATSFGPIGFIHNGADDNASGTSGLLEIAEAITKLPTKPRRSILLAWWDGEEEGLLGSKHWISQPTIARDRLVLDINMDMIGRLRNSHVEITGVRSAYGMRQRLSMINVDLHGAARPLDFDFQWECKSNSDHYPFFEAGIPIVMLHTGLHEDYHKPTDDADKINSAGMQQVARYALALLLQMADLDRVPAFRAQARQETSEEARRAFETPLAAPAARLGVQWSDRDRDDGLLVTAVEAGSAGSEAGLKIGDRLLKFNERSLSRGDLADDEEFIGMVWAAKSPAELLVRRSGSDATKQPEPMTVQLRGGPVRMGVTWRTDEAEPNSVFVVQLYRGAPLARAGVRVGDRIYAVGGRELRSSDEFADRLRQQTFPFELLVEHNGAVKTLVVRGTNEAPPAPKASEP